MYIEADSIKDAVDQFLEEKYPGSRKLSASAEHCKEHLIIEERK